MELIVNLAYSALGLVFGWTGRIAYEKARQKIEQG